MSRRVLILATTTGYQTRAFGDAAARLGVELIFATDRCHMIEDPWQDGAIPIRFHDEPASATGIVEALRLRSGRADQFRPIDGILTVGDRPTVIAAHVAQQLGLPWHPPEAAEVARDKQRTRIRLRDAGLPVPWFTGSAMYADAAALRSTIDFPCVIKPVALSGSRGVMRANDADEFTRAFARLQALMRQPDIRAEQNEAHQRLLIEGFIPGREFALEGLLHQRGLTVLALFDKPDPLDGPFFEETIYVTPSSLDAATQERVVETVARAAAAIGLTHGPIHAECRINDRGIYVLEVAARPIGGLCARALRFLQPGDGSPGRDSRPLMFLEELLLRHALGESPDGWQREPDASGVMMIPIPQRGVYRGVSGVDAATAVDGVDDVAVTVKPDQVLVPLPEGASYLGFVFAHGGSAAVVERALREAHARLHFAIDPELRVVQSAHGAM